MTSRKNMIQLLVNNIRTLNFSSTRFIARLPNEDLIYEFNNAEDMYEDMVSQISDDKGIDYDKLYAKYEPKDGNWLTATHRLIGAECGGSSNNTEWWGARDLADEILCFTAPLYAFFKDGKPIGLYYDVPKKALVKHYNNWRMVSANDVVEWCFGLDILPYRSR